MSENKMLIVREYNNKGEVITSRYTEYQCPFLAARYVYQTRDKDTVRLLVINWGVAVLDIAIKRLLKDD